MFDCPQNKRKRCENDSISINDDYYDDKKMNVNTVEEIEVKNEISRKEGEIENFIMIVFDLFLINALN